MGSIYFSQIHPSCRLVYDVYMHNEAKAENKLATTYRILYVQEGSINYKFDDKYVLAQQGDLIFLPPGQIYSTYQDSCDVHHISIYFSLLHDDYFDTLSMKNYPSFMGEFNHTDLAMHRTSIADTHIFDTAFHCKNVVILFPLITQLIKEFNERHLQHKLMVNTTLTQILITLLRLREGNQSLKQAQITEKLISYINGHYMENLTCQTLGKHFHYHPNYLNQLIKTTLGMSLHKYISNTKIHYANILLTQTSDSISDIAEKLGFSSISRFYSFYRSNTGYSPTEWRKKYTYMDI